jgi:hypothetical protein
MYSYSHTVLQLPAPLFAFSSFPFLTFFSSFILHNWMMTTLFDPFSLLGLVSMLIP